MKKKLSVVLGMHRSGTSLITRSLGTLGFQFGDTLMQSVKGNNDKGFWEDLDIYELNEEILDYCNKKWWSIEPISNQDVNNLIHNGFQSKAISLINEKVKNVNLLGLKDPRIAKLFKFWSTVFEKVDAEITYIFALRNPMSVAYSLQKRDGIEFCHSYLAWTDHCLSILGSLRGKNWITVEYEKIIVNTDEELGRLSELTGQAKVNEELREFKNIFIDKTLQHTHFTLEDCENCQEMPDLCREIYKNLAHNQINGSTDESLHLLEIINRWDGEFLKMYPICKSFDIFTERIFEYRKNQIIAVSEAEEAKATVRQAQAITQQAQASTQQAQAITQQAQAEAQQAHAEAHQRIKEMEGSTSWKITLPLRKLMSWLK